MAHVLVRHTVEDFDRWKTVYDDHRSTRDEAGLSELNLWRNSEDQNEVVMLFDAPDMEKAQAFLGSDDLKETMQNAGVSGPPHIMILE